MRDWLAKQLRELQRGESGIAEGRSSSTINDSKKVPLGVKSDNSIERIKRGTARTEYVRAAAATNPKGRVAVVMTPEKEQCNGQQRRR